MSSDDSVWERLGIARARDAAEIRRAYAKQLRVTRPEEDPVAFQALRAALDAALAYAAGAEIPAAARPVERETELETSRRARAYALHAAFTQLQDRLVANAPASEAARALIDALHQTDVEIAAECELLLAQMLMDLSPRADAIVPLFVEKLGWVARAADWSANPIFDAVVQRSSALDFLRALESKSTAMSKALCFLRSKQTTWRYRAALAMDASLEQTMAQLLHYLHSACPAAFALLNREALAWWNAYFERARSRPHGFDLFWLAAALLLPVVAIVAPVSRWIDGVIFGSVALSALWAIWVRKPSRRGAQESRWLRPGLSLLFNLPIGLWWALTLASSHAETDARVAVAMTGTLLAFAFARRRLIEWWMLRLDVTRRRWFQAVMTAVAFIALAAAVGTDQRVTLSAVAALVTAIVLLHRMPASQLSATETRMRIAVTLGTWTALSALLSLQKLDELALLRMGTVLFSAGVLITLALCLSGETPEPDALRLRNREIS